MNTQRSINWVSGIYLIIIPLACLTLVPWAFVKGYATAPILIYTAIHYFIDTFSITTYYHRLVSHRSYEMHPWLQALFMVSSAGTIQNSALIWCSDHRRHHSFEDTEKDPYNIRKGFFWAHMGWMFFKDPPEHRLSIPKDLKDDPIVQWQDRYYLPLALTVCFGIPTLFGYFVGNPIGGLLIGGVMRVFLSSHATFLINSAAHTFGKPTYSNQLTAKDNPLLAFFTCGEGFHNFHHKFQNDYRNGIRWFHWDPTKWGINFFAKLGLAKNLRITPEEKILLSQLQVEQENLQAKGANCEKLNFLQNAILQLQDEKRNLIKKLEELRRNQSEYSQIIYNELQKKIIECQKSLKNSYQEWMKEKKYLLSHLSVTH